MKNTDLVDSKYRLREELTRGPVFALHRGTCVEGGKPVLLKVPLANPPRPMDVAGLLREKEVLAQLAEPFVLSPIGLEASALALEAVEAAPLARLAELAPVERFLRVAAPLARAIGRVHAAGFSHRRLRTESVLVDPGSDALWITDFHAASRLAEQGAEGGVVAVEMLSPEQTGRINRAVDYRCDLYALGSILYEVLTGRRPFEAKGPLELVHALIAKQPVRPSALSSAVPEAASGIVMKLLSKMAEDRYQSGDGLLADVERFAARWRSGDGTPFPLGTAERAVRFTVARRLYGRARELAQLESALLRAASGDVVFAFVSGDGGAGKTSLVHELRETERASRARFLAGKFDQIERGVPYSALAGALSNLRQEPPEIAARVVRELGASAGALARFVPELGEWLGPVPEVRPLGPTQTENRLAAAFGALLRALARPGEPLIVFLDDLQWADSGTVRLLSAAVDGASALPLLFVGAYRGGEVSAGDPVSRLRRSLEERGAAVVDVRVPSLRAADLRALLADTLRRSDEAVDELEAIVREKTDGNPYFVVEFLESLGERGLVTFDAAGQWSFDAAAVRAANMTDNVLDHMAQRLRRLPPRASAALALASCLGDPFPLRTLSLAMGKEPGEVACDLWEAIREGLLVPLREDYEAALAAAPEVQGALQLRFSHDRVKQAAHEGIPEKERAPLHLAIGRALRATGEGALFEAVSHLNRARALLQDASEREDLASLNLIAGRSARARGAVAAARDHFHVGLELCEPGDRGETWGRLSVEAAECDFLSGDESGAERRLDEVQASAMPEAVKLEGARIRVVRYENTGRFERGIEVATAALATLGFEIPSRTEEREALVARELARIDALLAGRSFEALVELPSMGEGPGRRMARLLASMWPSAFLRNEGSLTALLSARLVSLSLESGNAGESALGYVTHAITLNARDDGYAAGNALGRAGLALAERQGDVALTVPVHHLFGSFIAPFGEPLDAARERAEACHLRAAECGDFTHASRAAFLGTWYAFFGGETLAAFEERALGVIAFLRRVRHEMIERAQEILLQWARALRGLTASPLSLTGGGPSDGALDAAFERVPVFRGFLEVARGYLAVLFRSPEAGVHVARAREALRGSAETLWHAMLDLLQGLALTAGASDEDPLDAGSRAELDAILRRVERRRDACPHNFAHQAWLLTAERARVNGDPAEAEAAFRAAVSAADENGSLPARALSRELYARFSFARGEGSAGARSLRAAASFWGAWGALAKVDALEREHPRVFVRDPAAALDFDAQSVLRAASAIASELEWELLLPSLVRVVVENAAAERGVLLECRSDALVVVAEGGASAEYVLPSPPVPLADRDDVPRTVIDAAVAAEAPVLSADARSDARFRDDAAVRRSGARAVLCVPILRQGRLAFVVYLENHLAADVFTESRVEVIRVLAAQAAISLENARLYQAMKAEVARRAEAEAQLQRAVQDLEALKNRLQAENVYLQEEIRSAHDFEEIVGNSPRLLEALDRVERVAATDSSVLVIGDTGTGKELFARAIHARSPRSARPLVKVNCGAIATGLVESELFGHVKGAFTGALTRRVGRFELADGGTLFLDEVSELPLDTQTKLLRVLQEREFEPVGSNKTVRVDVRVIAASNKNLDAAVKAGTFRADLLYRLNVFPISVPALRDRPGDIPLLVAFFVTRLAKKLGKNLQGFSQESMARLLEYPWPGNVRELQNVVERAAVFATGPVLDARFLAAPPEAHAPPLSPRAAPEGKTLLDLERDHIVKVLETSGWVIEGARGAATVLGLHPNTLRSRMKRLGIVRLRS